MNDFQLLEKETETHLKLKISKYSHSTRFYIEQERVKINEEAFIKI